MDAGDLWIAFIFLCVILHGLYAMKKARKIASDYFINNKIEILEMKYKWWAPKLFYGCSNQQSWFHTKLRNAEGETAEAYVKVGHWLFGNLKPIVQIYQVDGEGNLIDRTGWKSIFDLALDTIIPESKMKNTKQPNNRL